MADRMTPWRDIVSVPIALAAGVTLETGHMVAVNASGWAVPAADAAGLTVIGISPETVQSISADGMVPSSVDRNRQFRLQNSAANPVTQAHMGKTVYVEDSVTVASAGGTNSITAGKCLGVDSAGVWVEIA